MADMDPARALAAARPLPYWLDDPARPDAEPALAGAEHCDLLVIGGGYSGLWTALLAKERDPDRDVVLVEGGRIGAAASGRNGGFCAASLTHGTANGLARWPEEFATLQALGERNLDAIEAAVARYGLDCEFERTGEIDVATADHQVEELREAHATAVRHGLDLELLDRDQVRAEVDSPTFRAGLYDRSGVALVHPAKLAWGLKRAATRAACGFTSTPPPRPWSGMAPRSPCAPRTAGCSPTMWPWAPACSPPCCAAPGTTPCRSTTTP